MQNQQKFFHCKLSVIRWGKDYGLKKKRFINTMHLFWDQEAEYQIFVGESNTNSIIIPGIQDKHAIITFSRGLLKIESISLINVIINDKKYILDHENLSFSLDQNNYYFSWTIVFPNKTKIKGKIYSEKELLEEKTASVLTEEYAEIQKIQEGKSSLIFKTKGGAILKVLKPCYAQKSAMLRKFINAAQKFQALKERYFFPKVHEIVYHNRKIPLCYARLEYFEGQTLQNYLSQKGVLILSEAQKIIQQIAHILLILEKYRYYCCNISPSNILIDNKGKIGISSFFLMKSQDDKENIVSAIEFSPYLAPEYISNPKSAKILADVFSLGVLFYTMLAGEGPFYFKNLEEYSASIKRHEEIQPEQIQEMMPSIPLETCKIISSLLCFNPQKRLTPKKLLDRLNTEHDIEKLCDVYEEELDKIEKESEKKIEKDFLGEKKAKKEFSVMDESISFIALLAKVENELSLPKDTEGQKLYSLKVLSSNSIEAHTEYNITKNLFLVGRDGDIAMPNDSKMEEKHAVFEFVHGDCWLKDLDTHHGTYINGKKIEKAKLSSGDKIILGETTLLFQKLYANVELSGTFSEETLTEEMIGQLKELRISNISPSPVYNRKNINRLTSKLSLPKLVQNNENLQQMYHEMVGNKKKIRQETVKKARKDRIIKNSIFFIIVLLVGLFIFFLCYILKNKNHIKQESSVTLTGSQKELPPSQEVKIEGKITRIFYLENSIQYFSIMDTETKQHAVYFSQKFCMNLSYLTTAQKENTIIIVHGVKKILQKGRIKLGNNAFTMDYIEPYRIEIAGQIFIFQ